MNKALPILLAGLIVLAGCMDTETRITIKTDGSGLIQETMLMKNEMAEQLKGMNAMPNQEAGKTAKPREAFKLYKLEDLQKKAPVFGQGVRFVSVKDIATATHTGYVATYSFNDISKVRIDQNPKKSQDTMKGDKAEGEFLKFSFQKGKEPELVILIPERKFESEKAQEGSPEIKDAAPADPAKAEQELKQMKMILDGMRMALRVEIQGKIVKTTASYVNGSTITLYDIEFSKFLDNTEKLKALNASKPKSMEEIKSLLKDIPGLVIEPEHQIKVTFSR